MAGANAGSGIVRVASENHIQFETPKRYGNGIYVYSGAVDSTAITGRDVMTFWNIDLPVKYKIYWGIQINSADDHTMDIRINDRLVWGSSDNEVRDNNSYVTELIIPPSASVVVKLTTLGVSDRTMFVNFIGEILSDGP